MRTRSEYGFTLIEIMVVVIIVAALAGMIVPKFMPATNAAKIKIARADMKSVSTALELYRLYCNRYPTTEEGLDILLKPGQSKDWPDAFLDKTTDPWGRKYQYRYPGTQRPQSFDLWSEGPDDKNPQDNVAIWDESK
jgi:general secretion pathway protein G